MEDPEINVPVSLINYDEFPTYEYEDYEIEEEVEEGNAASSSKSSEQEEFTNYELDEDIDMELEAVQGDDNYSADDDGVKKRKPAEVPLMWTNKPSDGENLPYEHLIRHPLLQKAAWEDYHRKLKLVFGSDDEEEGKASAGGDNQKNKKGEKTNNGAQGKSKHGGGEIGSDDGTQVNQDEDPLMLGGIQLLDDLKARIKSSRKKYKVEKKKKNRIKEGQPMEEGTDSQELFSSDDDDDEELDYIKKDENKIKECAPNVPKLLVPQYEIKVKLRDMHFKTITVMSPTEVGKLCKEVLPEIKNIMSGKTNSERHNIFHGKQTDKSMKQKRLQQLNTGKPFSPYQEHFVRKAIEDNVLKNKNLLNNEGVLVHYFSSVLFPEALIRIFAKANRIRVDLAEKELLYGAEYDGELPRSVIRTVEPSNRTK